MRIVSFGDIHMSLGGFRAIPNLDTADCVILTGDLTNYGGHTDAREILDQVLAVNNNVLAQIGNLDNPEVNDYLQELDMNLHGQARVIGGQVCLIGVGGSNITPFNTPSEFSEEELAGFLNRAHSQALKFMTMVGADKMPLILVAHTPPVHTELDKLPGDIHVGSSAVREFIEEVQPALCLTGHIHEAKGEDRIGQTPVINPGMIKEGGWIDITIDGTCVQAGLQ